MKRVLFAAAVVLGAGGCGAGEEASDRVSDPAERARQTADRAEQRPDDLPEDPGY
jgi:hypothetical protein